MMYVRCGLAGVTVRIFGFYNYSLRLYFCEYLIHSLVVGNKLLVTLVVKYTSPNNSWPPAKRS